MKKDRFVTPTWTGHFDISPETLRRFHNWLSFEKDLDPSGALESTTQNGWQYMFGQWDSEPDWLKDIGHEIEKIKKEINFVRAKSSWVVSYNPGGYQDPHFHNIGIAQAATILINLEGTGEVVLQDPRQLAMAQGLGFAEIVTLHPGDWLVMPAYLIHNSRPCLTARNILVMDVYVDYGL